MSRRRLAQAMSEAAGGERARSEAAARKLDIRFYVVEMRNPDGARGAVFDSVIRMDNALAHWLNEEDFMRPGAHIRQNCASVERSLRVFERGT